MKNNYAITLISLIITIILLLIIATVSISLIINSGIVDKAKYAVDKYSEEEIGEQIKLAVLSTKMKENGNLTKATLEEELQNFDERVEVYPIKNNFEIIFNDSFSYLIDQDGNIINYDNNKNTKYLYNMGNNYIDWEIWFKQIYRTMLFNNDNITTNSDTLSYSWGAIRNTGKSKVNRIQ